MGKVKSFDLQRGTRVAQYEILSKLGRGWEGEVYTVQEVPTEALRAMKIVRHSPRESVRDRVHTAWYFEQLAPTGTVARYYHMGHWFFTDDEGVFYFVFEHLPGENLRAWLDKRRGRLSARKALETTVAVVKAISRVHEAGFAVGDFGTGENLIVLDHGSVVKICDCNPGRADHPNIDFRNDVKEFRRLLPRVFASHGRHRLFREAQRVFREQSRRQPPKKVLSGVYAALSVPFDDESRH